MHTSLSMYAKADLRLGRTAPQRSRPPVRDGQGGGWRHAPCIYLLQRSDFENQESWSDICRASDWKQTAVLVVPPSLSLPHMGGGNAGTALHTSHSAFAFASRHMCMPWRESGTRSPRSKCCQAERNGWVGDYWVPAFAGTTAETHCFMSSESSLWPDRGARFLDDIFGRGVQLGHDLLDLCSRQGRNVDPHLAGVRLELRVLHGGVEAGAQDRERIGRDAGRRDIGALKYLLADDQLDDLTI